MACNVAVIIKSVTWNGDTLDHAVAYSYVNSVQRIAIQNQGQLGYGCRPIVGRDMAVSVDFLTAPPIAPSTTTNTLTIQCLLSDGVTTETKTFDTMLADGHAVQHQDRTAARWTQTFIYQGDYTTEGWHIA